MNEPLVIGWAEYVDIPEWNVMRLRAKMDTGARSSALHVENIQEVGDNRVRFDVRLHRRKLDRRVTVEAPVSRRG
ncbi:MAG TPA: RimK/LysX family protein, partial [Polyangiaceae bacterium]|nr:RimK/LysX family protein [Polyangiaceae bacterium]